MISSFWETHVLCDMDGDILCQDMRVKKFENSGGKLQNPQNLNGFLTFVWYTI